MKEVNAEIIEIQGCFIPRRRGACFLNIKDDKFINAYEQFLKLKRSRREKTINEINYWVNGLNPSHSLSFCHGWSKSEYGGKYVNCFQFDLKPARFYGFLFRLESCPKFQFFVCVHYFEKRSHSANTYALDKIVLLSQRSDVISVLKKFCNSKMLYEE
ncbi:hypothetical protein JXQ70_12015 [bacterium]|nr:hypothetical protein [bacterium]